MTYRLSGYGIEHFGLLKAVLLHRPPQTALKLINQSNYQYHLFDQIPDIDDYLEEHTQYARLLGQLGVKVIYLADLLTDIGQLNSLPNLTYLHDIAVISQRGFILSRMAPGTRYEEDQVVKEGLTRLGIPSFIEVPAGEIFEGCLLLSPDLMLIADTERHDPVSITRFIPYALNLVKEVVLIDIPQARRFMHPDMVMGRIREDLALIYLPAIQRARLITINGSSEIEDFPAFMRSKNIDLISVSDEEQQKWATSFVAVKPGLIVHYDIALSPETRKKLSKRGVEIIDFHPRALLSGGGSLRCLTLRLWREGN